MRTIISIEFVEEKLSGAQDIYWITHATVDDGTEVKGWGKHFEVGDEVEVFFHKEQVKMKKKG